jgi:glycosyltransferase involved in cell wall biosynthesis
VNRVDFSIVIPVYRSVETLEPIFDGVKAIMDELVKSFEVIFIEDNSGSASWQELLRLKKMHPENMKIIRLAKNFGQNGATLCGIDEASGMKIITLDDDLQVLPQEIKKVIAHQKATEADVVYGIFPKQKNSWIRNFGSRVVKRIFGGKRDSSSIGSAFRLINTNMIELLKNHSQDHLFINQVVTWYTNDIQQIEVEHNPRQEGKSGYSLWKLITLSLRLIIYYTSIPLKIMIFLSIMAAFGILGLTAYYIYYQLEAGISIDIFMITVLIAMAMISASISVFGVYINRIYSARVKKPNYAIKIKL